MSATIRVMTLNLRTSAASDGPNAWPLRWPYVKALIEEVAPQVLGVQECLPDQLAAIMGEVAGYYAYIGPDTMVPHHHPMRNPIFICEQCPRPLSEGALALNQSGVIGQVSWDGRESRLAHWCRFDGWTLVNTHFDAWDCKQARYESARLLTAFFQDDPAVLIMGDLNCGPDEPPIQHFRQAGYTLAKNILPPGEDRTTFHNFTGRGVAELDYILLRGLRARRVIIPRPRQEPPYLSDHDPLVAEVEIA